MDQTERDLIKAIFDDMDDDAVRLVYADYLEEKGDPRGEFIRLQIARARKGEHAEPCLRETELLERYSDEWLREAQPYDPKKVAFRFERGLLANAYVENGTDEDLAVLRRLPGLRLVSLLNSCRASPAGVEHVVSLKHLCRLYLEQRLDEACLKVLDDLPVSVQVSPDGFPNQEAWLAFRARQVAKFDQLPAAERRRIALRFLRNVVGNRDSFTDVGVGYNECIYDPEMRLLREVPELETFEMCNAGDALSSAGLQQLAGLPNLKSVKIDRSWRRLDSIRPLTACPTLEVLQIEGAWNTEFGDEGTEGLDRLTNLRVLHLECGGLRDATVRRLRSLRQLQELELEVEPLADENCLKAIAGLNNLERLKINSFTRMGSEWRNGGLSGAVLRHLCALRKLHSLDIHLVTGGDQEVRHLAGLTELSFLYLSSKELTDASLEHLAKLRNLRTLVVQPSSITKAGAEALVKRLPALRVLTMTSVVKAPRLFHTFRRDLKVEWASGLFPDDWRWGAGKDNRLWEDGWDHSIRLMGQVGPAIMSFYAYPARTATVDEELQRLVDHQRHSPPHVQERDLVHWPDGEAASCIFQNDHSRYLLCVAIQDGQTIYLICEAAKGRFEEFRSLFLFVARSVRLGNAAREGVSERIEVPVSELDTFVP